MTLKVVILTSKVVNLAYYNLKGGYLTSKVVNLTYFGLKNGYFNLESSQFNLLQP